MDVAKQHEGHPTGGPHGLPFDRPIGTSPQLTDTGREKTRNVFRNSEVADNPGGCVTIFGFQEVLEFLQVRYEVDDIIMQSTVGKEGG